jgi:hypothetical protein
MALTLGAALSANAAGPEKLDSACASREPQSELLWYNAKELTVEGKGWKDTASFYDRLPARAEKLVTEGVWNGSRRSAGIAIRFVTDSTRIGAVWDGGGAMNHMAATGNSGLDLYVRRDGGWSFCGVGRPNVGRTVADLAKGLPAARAEYLLYLPLYARVTELKIGVEPSAAIWRAPPRPAGKDKPLVFYGTSITQGGCASRAGMCHPAILGRWLDRETINLGFSGAGKMEPVMADLLAELDAAVYVLECLPNMTTDMVRERVRPFVHQLRRKRPDTPILLVESPIHPATNAGNKALLTAFEALREEGVRRLFYLTGDGQLAGDEEGTVDGVHPTDLGFFRMALEYRPALESILRSER